MRDALARCSFLPGHPDKRFVRSIANRPVETLTERQLANIARLAWRYRRQMPHDLVPSRDAVEAIVAGRLAAREPRGGAPTVYHVAKRRTVHGQPPMPPLLRAMVKG